MIETTLSSLSRGAIATLVLVLVCAARPATAGSLKVAVTPGELGGPARASGDTLSLSLDDAYAMALRRNLDLQVGRFGLATADAAIRGSGGVFDPTVTANISGDYSESPAATQLAGAQVTESRNTSFGLGLAQLLPSGTSLSVETGFTRSETNSQFFFLNPRWGSDLTLTVEQPLLNGFGTLVNRSGIVIARNSREQTAAGFETTVIATLQQVENAYWDLVATREAITVKQRSLELAQRLLDETAERVKVGTSAAIDLVQSQAGVATRRQELIYARNAAANAEDALKAVLGFDRPEEWEVGIVTSESYEAEPLTSELGPAIEVALAHRPSLAQKRLELEVLELNLKLAQNGVLPSLGLQATYGYSGIGGSLSVEDPVSGETITSSGGFNDALTQLRKAEYPHWTLGVQLSMPLGNHEARATVAQRRYELATGKVELEAVEQQIIRDVRTAVRALGDGAAAVEAAVASRGLAQRNLEAEETKFANGLSTNYQVLQIQDDLAQAELAELQARIDYRKAITGYRVATGTLLDALGVEIEDPGAVDAPHDYWGKVKWLQLSSLGDAASRVTRPAEPATTKDE